MAIKSLLYAHQRYLLNNVALLHNKIGFYRLFQSFGQNHIPETKKNIDDFNPFINGDKSTFNIVHDEHRNVKLQCIDVQFLIVKDEYMLIVQA